MQKSQMKRRVIAGSMIIIVCILGIVALNDFMPEQKTIEKTVVYGQK